MPLARLTPDERSVVVEMLGRLNMLVDDGAPVTAAAAEREGGPHVDRLPAGVLWAGVCRSAAVRSRSVVGVADGRGQTG